MKRTTRRLLSLLMAVVLCLGLTPVTAWAMPDEWPEGRTEINSVSLNINAPKAGEKPNFDIQATSNDNYTVNYV